MKTDKPRNRTLMRRSSSGVKFRPERFNDQLVAEVNAGYRRVAKKYGWADFKSDEVAQ